MITAVITSCGRYDLLEQTLWSFFEMNSWPLSDVIVVEDGTEVPQALRDRFAEHPIEWVTTGARVSQIAAIDYAYSRVRTPYIFHIEDDWLFYRPGFLERSLVLLESNPKCVQVWLRAVDDTQGHPVLPHIHVDQSVSWRRLAFDYRFKGEWHGFSFNPGLRRLQDYVAIGGYGVHALPQPDDHGAAESAIGKRYRERDFFAAILCERDGSGPGYVRHLGDDRRVIVDREPDR